MLVSENCLHRSMVGDCCLSPKGKETELVLYLTRRMTMPGQRKCTASSYSPFPSDVNFSPPHISTQIRNIPEIRSVMSSYLMSMLHF